MKKRAIILLMDSVGIGELPDADRYGDQGSNTLVHTASALGGLYMPHMATLGLGNILPIPGVPASKQPLAAWGRMAEVAPGKDTTSGHWEIAGCRLTQPFPTYPQGFPPEIIQALEQATGRGVLGNCAASGTEIIQRLGEEHLKTGKLIVYTSADSVMQIAAHNDVVPLEELYAVCEKARGIMTGPHAVARVIARPFIGTPGNFTRTKDRHDYSILPPAGHLLEKADAAGYTVAGVGKIRDIFAGSGVNRHYAAAGNPQIIAATLKAMAEVEQGILWTNLVDFDMLYGHRNDVQGYGRALEELDRMLPQILDALRPDDLLFITADHGADPTTPSTDHSREYVPLLVYGGKAVDLGTRQTFADLGATIAQYLELPPLAIGTSMLPQIQK